MCLGTWGLHSNIGWCLSSRWRESQSRLGKERAACCTVSSLFSVSVINNVCVTPLMVSLFVCVCVCALHSRDELCGRGWGSVDPVAFHSVCSRPHHAPLCPSHTHRGTFIQSTMLTDWARRPGGGRWGTKALGGVTELGKNWIKCVCVFVSSEELYGVVLSLGCPGYMCWVEGYSKQWPHPHPFSLSPMWETWAAVAMCHVLHILSLSASSENTLSVYVGFVQTAVCLSPLDNM